MPVGPRTVNDVSCATWSNDEGNFSWQAQFFVMLDNNFCYFPHCTKRFIVVQGGTGSTELRVYFLWNSTLKCWSNTWWYLVIRNSIL